MSTLPEYMVGNTRHGLILQIKEYEEEKKCLEERIVVLKEALKQFQECHDEFIS